MDSALPYRFHPIIANTYTEVHSWLQNLPKAQTYNQKNIRNKIDHLLSESSMLSAAAQFYIYFPAHFFKVTHAFENSVGIIKLLEWLKYNPRICIVDVGCGAGAASASFIDMLLKLYDDNLLSRPIELFLIGIDINPYAIALYDKYMTGLKRRMTNYDIKIDYRLIPHGDYQATNRLQNFLNEKRNFWQQPYISQILIMQVNVVSPFSQRFNSTQSQLTELAELDIDIEMLGDYHEVFGREEALAYRQLMENVAIDHLNIFTIGTQGWENRVGEMAAAIDQQFSSESHRVERLGSGQHRVNYVLPEGCYWTDWKSTKEYHSDFRLDVSVVSNTELEDADWNAIVNIENLKLAWARARRHLQDQVLVDEVEIRLFEIDLEYNLSWLQKQLEAYAADVIHSEDRVLYHFPKSTGSTRPRGLSRIEEEILSTALVQKLGQKIVGLTSRSYAYRFSRNYGESNTEYLYEYWFESYSRYINHARQEVLKHEKCAVIQTDIRSFYTKIIQEQLIEIATDRLSRSSRFEWLLRTLLIDDLESHEAGRGIIQGNLGSGFYANLYLVDLDAYFSVNNEWNAEYFRWHH